MSVRIAIPWTIASLYNKLLFYSHIASLTCICLLPSISIDCAYSKLNYILSGQVEIAFSAWTPIDNSVHKVLRKYNILNSKHTPIRALKFEVNQRYQIKLVHFFYKPKFWYQPQKLLYIARQTQPKAQI